MKKQHQSYKLTETEAQLIAIIRKLDVKGRNTRLILLTIKCNQFEIQPIGNQPHTLIR